MINDVHFYITKKDINVNTITRILQRRLGRDPRKTSRHKRTLRNNALVSIKTRIKTERS